MLWILTFWLRLSEPIGNLLAKKLELSHIEILGQIMINRKIDSCCEKITLFRVENKGPLILVLQLLSCQQLFKQMFSGCPMNFCFFWYQKCMHNSVVQLNGKVIYIIKSPYFSAPKRVIFSQHASNIHGNTTTVKNVFPTFQKGWFSIWNVGVFNLNNRSWGFFEPGGT